MRKKYLLIILLFMISLFSCSYRKSNIQYTFKKQGVLDIKLDSFGSCHTDYRSKKIIYSTIQEQKKNICLFDKKTGNITVLENSSYDEYDPIYVNNDEYLYISKEFDIRGDIVYFKNGKRTILENKGVHEKSLSLNNEKNKILFISYKKSNKKLNIWDLNSKKEIYRKTTDADHAVFGKKDLIFLFNDNKIYKYNIKEENKRNFFSSFSLKYTPYYDHKNDILYYISIPFDTNKNQKLDKEDAKFITEFKNGKEYYIKIIDVIKNFSIDEKNLYYIKKRKLNYEKIDEIIPEFTTSYQYYNYIKNVDNHVKKFQMYNLAIEKFSEKDTLYFIYSKYLSFLKKNGYLYEFKRNINLIFKNYNKDRKIYYYAQLISNRLNVEYQYKDIYHKFLFDSYFSEEKYKKIIELSKKVNLIYYNKKLRNEINYYTGISYLKMNNETKGLNILLEIVKNNLTVDEWVRKSVNSIINLTKQNNGNIASINFLGKIKEKYNNYDYLYTRVTIEISKSFQKMGDYAASEKILVELLEKKTNLKELIIYELLNLYEISKNYEKGVDLIDEILEENYYGEYLNQFISFLNKFCFKLSENAMKKDDLLEAKKWMNVLLKYLPENLKANRTLIEIYFKMGEIDRAAGIYKNKYQQNIESANYNYFLGYSITYLGSKYNFEERKKLEMGAYKKSLTYLKKAIKINPENPYYYLTIGWVYEQIELYEKKDYLEKTIRLYEKGLALSENKQVKKYFYRNLGNVYYKLSLYKRALEYFNYMEEINGNFKNSEEMISYKLKLSDIYFNTNNYLKGIKIDKKIIEYFKKRNDFSSIFYIYNHLGMLYNQSGNYLKAVDSYQNIIEYAKKYDLKIDHAIIYRNIAYNSLLAEDEMNAQLFAEKALELIEDDKTEIKKKGFLDFSLDIALSFDKSFASEGFNPQMERSLLYSILASSEKKLGNWEKAIKYYKLKLSITEGNNYGKLIINNNIYNIYYTLNNKEILDNYLNKSLEVSKKSSIYRGEIFNKLVKLILKDKYNFNDIIEITNLETIIDKINDRDINILYKIVYNFVGSEFLLDNKQYENINTAYNSVNMEMDIYKNIFENYEYLIRNIDPKNKNFYKRLELINRYNFFGQNILNKLSNLQNRDPFLDFLIFYDKTKIYLSKNNIKAAKSNFDKFMSNLNTTSEKNLNKKMLFMRRNDSKIKKIILKLLKEGYKNNVVYYLSSLANFDNFKNYIMYKPHIYSEIDKINIENYLYEINNNKYNRAGEFLKDLSTESKFIFGKLNLNNKIIKKILTNDEKILIKINEKYILITKNEISIKNEKIPCNFYITNKFSQHRDLENSYFNILQFYMFYSNRFISDDYSKISFENILDKNGGYFDIGEVEITGSISPFKIRINDVSLNDLIKKQVNITGLKFLCDITNIEFKNLIDVFLYLRISKIYINKNLYSYKKLDSGELDNFIKEKLSVYDRKAYLYYKNGKYNYSFNYLKKVIKLLSLKNINDKLISRLLLIIRIGANNLNNPELIIDYLKQYSKLKGYSELEFKKRLAMLYERSGYYKEAVNIYKKDFESNNYRIGVLYEKMGRIEEALKYLNRENSDLAKIEKSKIFYKYLNNYSKAKDFLKEIENNELISTSKLIKIFILIKKGAYDEALEKVKLLIDDEKSYSSLKINAEIALAQINYHTNNYYNAIKLIETLFNDRRSRKYPEEYCIALNLKILSYIKLGKYKIAKKEAEKAIEIASKYNIIQQLFILKVNKNIILINSDQVDKAITNLNNIKTQFEKNNNLLIINGILKNLGLAYYEKNKYEKSNEYFFKVIQNSKKITDPTNLLHAYYYIGKINNSIINLKKARELAEEINNKELLVKIYYEMGKIQNEVSYLEKSIEIIEDISKQIKIPEIRKTFIKKNINIYHDAIKYYFNQYNYRSCFNNIEKVKNINFYLSKEIEIKSENNKRFKKLSDFEKKLNYYGNLLMKNKIYKNKYEELKSEYEKIKIDYYLKYGVHEDDVDISFNFNSIKEMISDNNLLVSYLKIDDYYYLIQYDNINGFDGRKVKLSENNIQKKLNKLRNFIIQEKPVDKINDYGLKVYNEIFPDAGKNISEIIISPHGILNYIPFDVLITNENKYVIDIFDIRYVPTFKMLESKKINNNHKIFAVGNPHTGIKDLELYFAQKEAREIEFLFDKSSVNLLVGKNATETAIKNNFKNLDFNIIHFACHGKYNKDYPDLSYLLFANDSINDGFFNINEIKNIKIDSNIVILSACETGIGEFGSGEEILAMDRAFLSGGSRAVISSYWRISDVATAIFFKNFYRHIHNGTSIKKAFIRAKKYLKNRFDHPVYWASLKYLGN